jgi:hypothetical protein
MVVPGANKPPPTIVWPLLVIGEQTPAVVRVTTLLAVLVTVAVSEKDVGALTVTLVCVAVIPAECVVNGLAGRNRSSRAWTVSPAAKGPLIVTEEDGPTPVAPATSASSQ